MSDDKPKSKPMSEWGELDYLRAGMNVARIESKTRTANTATNPDGLKGTGFSICIDWDKKKPWAKGSKRKN